MKEMHQYPKRFRFGYYSKGRKVEAWRFRGEMIAGTVPKRFNVDEYHRMGEVGILNEDDRLELIEGEIREMSPIGINHLDCVNYLTEFLIRRLRGRFVASVQNPVRLSARTEPQPDLSLIDRSRSHPGRHMPGPEDVMSVIEVSDTTLRYDRNEKLRLYAVAEIPEAWIVDLPGEALERYSQPAEGTYTVARRAGRGEALSSFVIPDLTFNVDEVIGASRD